MLSLTAVAGAFLGAVVSGWGCGDPVHDAEVAALGPEAPGVSPGPTHRPGQPCLTCHGGQGPAGQTFVTAGTVFESQYTPSVPLLKDYTPVNGGLVHLVDANGNGFDAKTNSVGNFYVTTDQWNPAFPLGALSEDAGPSPSECIPVRSNISEYGGQISVAGPPTDGGCKAPVTPMLGLTTGSAIDRGGVYASCAYCHFDPPGPTSVGHVYVTASANP